MRTSDWDNKVSNFVAYVGLELEPIRNPKGDGTAQSLDNAIEAARHWASSSLDSYQIDAGERRARARFAAVRA